MLTNFYICVHYYTSKCWLKCSSDKGEKKYCIFHKHIHLHQAILSGFWLFGFGFFFLLFLPRYLWTACSRREPAYNCYLSRTVASCKPLKCHSLQLKFSRSVFSKEGCAQLVFFFFFERSSYFDNLQRFWMVVIVIWGIFNGNTWNITKWTEAQIFNP